MATGISINVGVNQVKSSVFKAPALSCCEADASAMFALACGDANNPGAGFLPGWKSPQTKKGAPLLGTDATYDNVVGAVRDAAAALKPGDVFLFTFAGHGAQTILEPNEQETDGVNETIVLVDHMILDTFWQNVLWPSFLDGVRAVAIVDCCHAKGVLSPLARATLSPGVVADLIAKLKQLTQGFGLFGSAPQVVPTIGNGRPTRQIEDRERRKELAAFKTDIYDPQRVLPSPPKPLNVSRILLSACQANEEAAEGVSHGMFTQALLNVWNSGGFQGDYNKFIADIGSGISNPNQHPGITKEGLPDFSAEHPFTINQP